MRRVVALILLLAFWPLALLAQDLPRAQVVSAMIDDVSVTVYRDPNRSHDQPINRDWLNGFALISETRTIDLPAGQSTIRFAGVAEGMVAVSAIVTGLPGGVVQKNRDAALLSPASLVDGTLGNRVTIRRTNPGNGVVTQEEAIIRTRADGGIVLQTRDGFEALRCAGLPEQLVFDGVPAGLSATPVLSIDTTSPAASRATVTLTYLASGFDWEVNYTAHVDEAGRRFDLLGWLTLANQNGQSFADAQLLAIAGTLRVESDYRALAQAPVAAPINLACYPTGSTAAGAMPMIPPPQLAMPAAVSDEIIVTAMRRMESVQETPTAISVVAAQEALGDLKLYRVPVRATVAAKGMKQVAMLVQPGVRFQPVYRLPQPGWGSCESQPLAIHIRTTNDRANGLGVPLPAGGIALFRKGATPAGDAHLLIGEASLTDRPVGQEVAFDIATSAQVQIACTRENLPELRGKWRQRLVREITNANPFAIRVEVHLSPVGEERLSSPSARIRQQRGWQMWVVEVPANARRTLTYQLEGAD